MKAARNDARSGSPATREWDAAAYHRVSAPQLAWGLRVLARIPLRGDENALDAGCGSGRLTAELARRLPRGAVVGCDLSENMTHRTQATVDGGGGRLHVVCADLRDLPFRDAFDLIFSTATLHWIADHARVFAAFRAVLRTGGRLEAQCGGGPNLERIHARAIVLTRRDEWRAYFTGWREPWHFATPGDTARRLEDAGFGSVRCWLEEAPATFATAAAYRDFLDAVVMRPFLAALPSTAIRDQFLDALVDAGAADTPAFTLDYWRLNLSAAAI